MSFWHHLPKPFFVLAPMADVTDVAFRSIIAERSAHTRADGTVGAADVTWTEFVSADGLALAPEEGRRKLLADLEYGENERPIVAQLFSSVPERMEAAAALCAELGFDGVDINMGCPDRSIEKQGCGAAMIKDPAKAVAVIEAAKRGAQRAGKDGREQLPVSVKTRLGYNRDELEEWLPALLAARPAAITLHARTRKEMSKVPARWERITRAVEIRDAFFGAAGKEHEHPTLILGNGDVTDLADARAKAAATGADGVMLGRAIFGNPWLFHPDRRVADVPLTERLMTMVEHTERFERMLPHKNFAIMKKHYKAYVEGFPGAKELRVELMEAPDAAAVRRITEEFVHALDSRHPETSATLRT